MNLSLVFFASLFPLSAFASTWVEDRERLVSKTLVNVSECEHTERIVGRMTFETNRAHMAYREEYELYQVTVDQDGWMGTKIVKIIPNTQTHIERIEMDVKRFSDQTACQFWVETQQNLLSGHGAYQPAQTPVQGTAGKTPVQPTTNSVPQKTTIPTKE